MAETDLFTDGSVPATEDDIIRARSKLLKAAWLQDVFKVADYPLLRAIMTQTDAEGTFNVFADDNVQDGEFAITFKHNVATATESKQMLVFLMQLARKEGSARVINTTIGKVFITTVGATKWADLAEASLGYIA